MRGISAGLFLLLCASVANAGQDSLVSIGDDAYLTRETPGGHITVLRYPALGCPTLIERGKTGTAILRLPDGGATTDFQLSITSTGDDFPLTYTLPVQAITYDAARGLYHVDYSVPAAAADDMYDLKVVIPSQAISDEQPNSFRVLKQQTNDFTFVVFADPQYSDPRGLFNPGNLNPGSFDTNTIIEQMKKEIRALKPDFALVCGDMLFGLDYDSEYDAAWAIWKDIGVPIFLVPGNHDGMAATEERTVLGITQPVEDGLDLWRANFGPTYFSFAWGGMHFQGVNTYDGTPERRDSFLIVNSNHGGDLSPEQMNWIADDTANASGTLIPFLHHNPLGPYDPNDDFTGFWGWVLDQILLFVTTGEFLDIDQVWNDPATADFLRLLYEGVAPMVFIGHEHFDDIQVVNGTVYKRVTSSATSSDDYWGYTVVTVVNSQIVDYLYMNENLQSVPTGNLHVKHTEMGRAEVTSGLSRSYPVTLEFTVETAPAYSAVHGTVLEWKSVGNGLSRVWVRVDTPVAMDIDNPETVEVRVEKGAAVAGSIEVGSRGSTSRCGPQGGGTGHALLLLLTLLVLLGARYRVQNA